MLISQKEGESIRSQLYVACKRCTHDAKHLQGHSCSQKRNTLLSEKPACRAPGLQSIAYVTGCWREAESREGQCARLVVADFKVQVLDVGVAGAAPVAAKQRVRPDEVECSGDGAAAAVLGHDQQHLLGHCLAKDLEELPRQVRLAPLLVCVPNIDVPVSSCEL